MATGALTEEIAQNLEEAAEATRKINSAGVGYFVGGVCFGAAIGFFFGYRFNREKIRAEIFKESEEELDKIREVYRQKAVAAQEKRSVEEIIEERGYSKNEITSEDQVRPLPPPVPIFSKPESAVSHEGWNYPEEMQNRSPEHPYVVHQDEFFDPETGYSQVTYTYYALDDVLVGEDERPIPHADLIVGQDNLKFGHGSDDENVVFIRNDKLELEMQVCRLPNGSYEQDVMGLEHSNDEPD